MPTEADFLSEIRRLRDDLGTTRPMRVKWRGQSLSDGPMHGLLDAEHYVSFALYNADAHKGDRPIIEVDAEIDERLDDIDQGQLVDVAGVTEPGHAVVVIVNGRCYWPRYPAALHMRPPRF